MQELLFIHEYDETILPDMYKFSHNVCVRLYDDLVWLIKDKKTQNKYQVSLKLKENQINEFDKEINIIKWLKKNGYEEEADEVVSKHLALSIISDFCHFIYQSLHSSKNIKLTVAFNLLRKPFLENLIIIEQLLNDEKAFLKKFDEKPESFDPGILNDNDKKRLISSSISKIKFHESLNSDLIFWLRFKKDNPDSLYAVSNLATHLVTTRNPSYKTENQNMNFIFSGFDEWETQLVYFYYFLPYLLYYATEIIDQYLFEKKIITKPTLKERKFYRIIGQLLHHDRFNIKSLKGKSIKNIMEMPNEVKCLNCNNINQLFKSDYFNIVHNDYLLCKYCLTDLIYESKSVKPLIAKFIKM